MNLALRTLTYLLLALFPFGLLFRVRLAENTLIVPQDLVVGMIFVLILARSIKDKQLLMSRFFRFQLLFIATGIIILLFNYLIFKDINLLVSLLYVLRYVSYLSLVKVGDAFKDSKYITKAIILSGSLFIATGYIQFIFYKDLRNLLYLGWDDHLYRLFSTFLDPNYAGVFYVMFTLLLIGIIIAQRAKGSYPYIVLSAFSLFAVFLTYSRTALVALVTGTLVLITYYKKYRLILVALVGIVILTASVSNVRIEGMNPLRTASSKERLTSLVDVYSIVEKSNFLGVGFNAFRYAQIRFEIRNEIGSSVSNADAGTDMSLLFVLATTGVVGFALFLASYYYLVRELLKDKFVIKATYVSMISALFAASLFLNVLFYTPILGFFFLILGLRKNIFKGNK